jgi:cell division protein FtsW
MTDQPQFIDERARTPDALRQPAQTERGLTFWQTLDKPLLIIVGILVAIGLMMVYSTTFDWSFALTGSPTAKVLEQARNIGIGIVIALGVLLFDHRRLRRLALLILIGTVAALIAVLLFGDDVFNARRSLIGGRFQPGELAELTMVIYMAAWLSSKNTRIRSLTYGLLPFAVLVGLVCGLVILQPDISTAVIIFAVCGVMFFLAGADLVQLGAAAGIAGVAGIVLVLSGNLIYAQDRVGEFIESITDITQVNYQVFQAYVAFSNGGLFGVGLGLSQQKFNNALPAPHTDSIFAIIGEEFGVFGATVVVALFVAFVARGLMIARRANDSYAALLAAGLTVWVVSKALLNIAVMLALVPPTGIALPFISFGGSSMVTVLVGTALILSVQRANLLREHATERRGTRAPIDRSRRDGRTRLPGAGSR